MKRLILMLFSVLVLSTPVSALLDEKTLDFYDKNGIYYYNPSGNGACSTASLSSSADGQITGSGNERVVQAVEVYGKMAMSAQKTYGVPWEVLIAQMQIESSVGTSNLAQNTNNWLGIRGSGDAGTYTTPNNGHFAKYSSVEKNIAAWAGNKVMRAGYYDSAFKYLDPDNYNLHDYLETVIYIYAPPSDGNDSSAYVQNVEAIIENIIRPKAKELGLPTSEEYAKQENIPIGGQYPIGTEVPDDAELASEICSTAGNGDINATALELSWPDRSHGPNDPKPEYKAALNEVGGVGALRQGDSCSIVGKSCDAFVATVMRHSGADPDFPCCGAANLLNYLASHPEKYLEIENIGSADNLEPGDIRSRPGHIEIYVEEDGVGKIASASHCDRTGDHARPYYPNASYRIFRRIK